MYFSSSNYWQVQHKANVRVSFNKAPAIRVFLYNHNWYIKEYFRLTHGRGCGLVDSNQRQAFASDGCYASPIATCSE